MAHHLETRIPQGIAGFLLGRSDPQNPPRAAERAAGNSTALRRRFVTPQTIRTKTPYHKEKIGRQGSTDRRAAGTGRRLA